jgi:hypothetical protein
MMLRAKNAGVDDASLPWDHLQLKALSGDKAQGDADDG